MSLKEKTAGLMTSVRRSVHKTGFKIKKHSPEILIVSGVVGVVASTVMACKATTKVNEILEKAKEDIDAVHAYMEKDEFEENYTEEDGKKALAAVYVKTGVDLVKLYAPSVILLSILPVVLGNAIINILFGAAVKDFIPEGKAGLFQGIRMIFVVLLPMVIGPFIGDMACRSAAQTIINEANAEVIVPAKNMFLWAGVVCIFALIPLYFLTKKGFETENSNTNEVAI